MKSLNIILKVLKSIVCIFLSILFGICFAPIYLLFIIAALISATLEDIWNIA